MIRYAVATVLLLYFLGADALRPYRPPVVGNGLAVFHREINRGVWSIVGPGITYIVQDAEEEKKKNAQ